MRMILNTTTNALSERRTPTIAALAALALITAACSGTSSVSGPATTDASTMESTPLTDAPPTENLVALATTSIWADVTSRALCEAPVDTVIPIGADPHSWEPSIRVTADLAAADLVIRNGLDLEEGLLGALDAIDTSQTTVVTLSGLISNADDDHSDADDHDHDESTDDDHNDHDHSGPDPHLWLDPVLVADLVDGIASAAVAAGWPTTVIDCAATYHEELLALDAEIADAVVTLNPNARILVTNHDALGRFADRYGFEVLGSVLPSLSTLAEANPADLAELATAITTTGVSAIFVDAQSSDTDAQALARRLEGVEVVTLLTGSLTSGTDDGRDYLTMMRTNTSRIVDALGS
ncbi:MAG: metal ABC transporter solute-binding protein, Zn/Mn family [Ilumatobacteraceae bacterium]